MAKQRFVDTLSPGDTLGNGFIFVKKLEDQVSPGGTIRATAKFKCPYCTDVKSYNVSEIKNNYTLSCGCYRGGKIRRKIPPKNKPLYVVWRNMHRRCYDIGDKCYSLYGGSGVTVCDRWHEPGGFERFELDMAPTWKPGLQLDKDIRFPGNKQYDRVTCQWVTPLVNSQNRRNTLYCIYLDEYMRLEEAANILGLNYRTTVSQWARRGVPQKYQHLVEIVGRKNVI
jgi:hypothetical protein